MEDNGKEELQMQWSKQAALNSEIDKAVQNFQALDKAYKQLLKKHKAAALERADVASSVSAKKALRAKEAEARAEKKAKKSLDKAKKTRKALQRRARKNAKRFANSYRPVRTFYKRDSAAATKGKKRIKRNKQNEWDPDQQNETQNGFGYQNIYETKGALWEFGVFKDEDGVQRYYYDYGKVDELDLQLLAKIVSEILFFKFSENVENSRFCTYDKLKSVQLILTETGRFETPQCAAPSSDDDDDGRFLV